MKESRLCDPELYQKVKTAITVQQAAEYIGLRPNAKGLCLCPFHRDTKPSLKLYPNGKGFYCFSCGTGGDQIKMVALYFNLLNEEAAERLAAAFQVPLSVPVTYREKREAALKIKQHRTLTVFIRRAEMYLKMYRILLCEAMRDLNDPHFLEAVHQLDYTDYLIESLEKWPGEVYLDKGAVKKIGEIERRITDWYFCAPTDRAVSR